MRTILITGASGGLVQEMVPLLKDDFLILLGRDVAKIEQLYVHHEKKAVFDVDIRDEMAL
ncbi:TPA: short-chain dehydrogenase, partial [Streptococcus suis]|nr:short-chain dehydrogenase [Streptococcus suis]